MAGAEGDPDPLGDPFAPGGDGATDAGAPAPEGDGVTGGSSGDGDGEPYVFPWVSRKTVASVLADWTGVPADKVEREEAERLLTLEDVLRRRVIGQDAAISALAQAIRVSRAGLTDPRKPIGVFLMCGPSGVGKTETALAIADHVFGGEDAMVTINMTEFKEAHKVSALLGASAGYVGYGQGGVLTEAVRRKPHCVLLLDEMEKAHPEIQDVFYQVFDKGCLTDGEGNRIDFRNTIVIMTSNAAGEDIREMAAEGPRSVEELSEAIKPLLLQHFRPAFLGRTQVIPYLPLGAEDAARIVDIHLARIRARVAAEYRAGFEWTEAFRRWVVARNADPLSGGRALERIVNAELLPALARGCIERSVTGDTFTQIKVSLREGAAEIEFA